jgi:MoxR-like ATPase
MMKGSNQQNLMLAGEPGAGKTLLVRMLAATLGLPCAYIRLGERSEKDELTQEVAVTDHGFEAIKAKLYWYVKYGGIVLFDDLSNADPNMFFSVTGGLLESPYEYTVNQETVKRHPLCIMLATTNVGTIGSQPMNQALLTRFGGHFVVERLSDKTFKECIKQRATSNSGTASMKQANPITDWSYMVYQSVLNAVKTVDRETADKLITLRAAISTAEKILNALAGNVPVDAKRAAREAIANILYTGGNAALQKAVSDAIDSIPNLTL